MSQVDIAQITRLNNLRERLRVGGQLEEGVPEFDHVSKSDNLQTILVLLDPSFVLLLLDILQLLLKGGPDGGLLGCVA